MPQGSRVLLIGLDAAEPSLLRAWAREGHLPALRGLLDDGVSTNLASVARHFPDLVWPALYGSRNPAQLPAPFFVSPARHGCGFEFFDDLAVDVEPFWCTAARHGRRCIVVDVPKTALAPPAEGIQLTGWGPHATFQPCVSYPEDLAARVHATYGRYPITTCDDHGRSPREYARLRRALLRAVELRQQILGDLIVAEPWDLFFAVFAETHCAGHHFWHLHDRDHPRHAAVPQELRSALRDVYGAVDRAIGRLVQAAGPNTQMVIFSGHGMRPQYHGRDLLPTLLRWWGMQGPDDVAPDFAREHTQVIRRPRLDTLREAIPVRWQYVVKRRLPKSIERRLISRFIGGPSEWLRARAYSMPNNDLNPAIRINVIGRDALGVVPAGRPFVELRDFLLARLQDVVNPDTGRPAFEHVTAIQGDFEGIYRDRLPDITALWSPERPIHRLYSPGYGTVVGSHRDLRTGGHSADGLLAMSQPCGFEPQLDGAAGTDVAPTVLSLLDVPVPPHMMGRPLLRAASPVVALGS
jgi:predicted AlkP superfamily phosphohydrolase/phosphomutase